jgi:hypothetical protein
MSTERSAEEIQRDIGELQQQLVTRREADAVAKVKSLEVFEAMTAAEKRDLFRSAPAHYDAMMKQLTEKRERAFFGR